MALRLRPLRDDEVEAFVAAARDDYADDLVRNAGANAGGPVGRLWFAERRAGGETVAWVYDLFVHEQHRRRGLARETMALLEDERGGGDWGRSR